MNEPKAPVWERDPEGYREKTKDRILAKVAVDPETGCWHWTGALVQDGGHPGVESRCRPFLRFCGRMVYAYRTAYELWVGPIPEGLGIDHLCANKLCVNPGHLEPVTTQENSRRYWERRRAKRRSALTAAGHPAFRAGGAR